MTTSAGDDMSERSFGPCQVVLEWCHGKIHRQCGRPSTYRYEAMGGGWMLLCEPHGFKHAVISEHIEPDGSITRGRALTEPYESPRARRKRLKYG
jgi:hypothetical protein